MHNVADAAGRNPVRLSDRRRGGLLPERTRRACITRAGDDAFHVEVEVERHCSMSSSGDWETPASWPGAPGASGGAGAGSCSGGSSWRPEPWLAAAAPVRGRACAPPPISNSGLMMAPAAKPRPRLVRARPRTARVGEVVGRQSILSSGRPSPVHAWTMTVTAPGSPVPSKTVGPGWSPVPRVEECLFSPLLKKKLEARNRKTVCATKIQALFRGSIARERVAALRRAEVSEHRGGLRATIISCGGCPFNHATGHTAAVSKSGKLFMWGRSGCGQLGLSSTQDASVPQQVGHCRQCNPQSRALLSLQRVTDVALGGAHSVALTESGRVYAWGSCGHGQLGHIQHEGPDATDKFGNSCESLRAASQRKVVPVPVAGLPFVTAIACGRYHTLALAQNGCVFSWGQGLSGQLGHGADKNVLHPRMVMGLEMVEVLACGSYHSAAVTQQG